MLARSDIVHPVAVLAWLWPFGLLAGCTTCGPVPPPTPLCSTLPLVADQKHFYSRDSARVLAEGFAAGAVLANTTLDGRFQHWYQGSLRCPTLDGLSEAAKLAGEGEYVIPGIAAALAISEVGYQLPGMPIVNQWSDRSVRAYLAGVPSFLFAQAATGGSRPNEPAGSHWNFFADTNGVSGHAFIGAVPFISAAQTTDDPWEKGGLYLASTLTAWSRVNDDDHFASQAILGWWFAYAACRAVNRTESGRRDVQFTAVPVSDGIGVGITFKH